ncbi:MAG: hypothetical protein NC132_03200 [Corallococcus sp.]|nr:hypothetical protein [Corallococcus sp.]MCM1359511.1 hypothetical protein [Corallococcus sp.]MCM1395103.1 hypothetical protein [Corallococcus sp.]
MKKVSRVLTLILVAVLVLGVFAGCGVFGRNNEKYRAQTIMTVGNETITVGKFIDTFNNYYNNYVYYIQAGYYTVDDVVELTASSLISQYMRVDAYKTKVGAAPYTHKWATEGLSFANEGYMAPSEMEYTIRYIKYVLFTTLDSLVDGYVKADYDLKEEETEDTSRDFVEYDSLEGFDTYSDYLYGQNFVNKDMDEYMEKNYKGLTLSTDNITVDNEYVYADAAAAKDRLDALNARLEDDVAPITFEQYKAWQEKALTQYKKNVKNTYNYDLDKLIVNQVEEYILSVIVAKYNLEVYSEIDKNDEKLQASAQELNKLYNSLKEHQEAGFNVNNNFVSFIEGLTDTSFIYSIPEAYKDSYIYVKNILIPFSDEQTTILSNLEKQGISTDDKLYVDMRNEFASAILAEDFWTEKDGDKTENDKLPVFDKTVDGQLIIKADGVLGEYFGDNGIVKPMTLEGATEPLSKNETIIKLMDRFNTDVGQHSTIYDYVVRIGETPDNYTAKWVQEFVDAANEAYTLANGDDGGTYALAVSSYGVHIVYYAGKVVAQEMDFSKIDITDLEYALSPEYRMFKNYFEKKASQLTESDTDALQKAYYSSKIVATDKLGEFLKENDFNFDLKDFLDLSKDENN